MKNVVKMIEYRSAITNAEACMSVIRDRMHWYYIDLLAADVGVSTSCLYAIKSGRTKWPRSKTFFGLVKHLDLELKLERRK